MAALEPLSPAELGQFVAEGFVVRRGLVPPERCAMVRDALWEHGHHHMRRDNPCVFLPARLL